ncbi:MAG: zf-TFIIB domain-containing protein [Deltaproteobacteria bacterium]|nr:zf-TFIIB domain-containing protein [Deltaproteobacteria bacterium]
MKCPRDGTEMAVVRHEAGVELDRCLECEGVWLDRGEIDTIRAHVTHAFDLGTFHVPERFDFAFSKSMQLEYATIACPKCGQKMETTEYAYWSQVLVDICPAGCGMWLDRDELKALEVFFGQNLIDEEKETAQSAMWASLTEMFGG